MGVIVAFILLVVVVLLVLLYIVFNAPDSVNQNSSESKNVIHYIGGGYGTVANDRQSAECMLYDELSCEGEVGVCQYLDGNRLGSVTGICHIESDGSKKIVFF